MYRKLLLPVLALVGCEPGAFHSQQAVANNATVDLSGGGNLGRTSSEHLSNPTIGHAFGPQQDLVKRLFSTAKIPDELDQIATSLGIPARLANFYLAAELDTKLGTGLYIPVQISRREGGRISTYYLNPGEAVITGVIVINAKLFYREVTRKSGESKPARTGDKYIEKLLDSNYNVVQHSNVALDVVDPVTLEGRFLIIEPTGPYEGGEESDPPACACWAGGSQLCYKCSKG